MDSSGPESSDEPSSSKRKSKIRFREEIEEKIIMMPSLFNVCHPIMNVDDIEGVLEEPPRWVERVEPLKPRSSTVLQNTMFDCHHDRDHYSLRKRLDARIVPKTLVCHDYKGGYQADKYLHYPNEDIMGNGYTFYNWAQIDIFVYFSHHLITIPPLCWINVGHNNGVKVLGTIITEFDSGFETCRKIFRDIKRMQKFAKSLAKLTQIFGFDGWLLNIENEIENIDILKKFVQYLTDLLHTDNPASLVIWYDSVTEDGRLLWQNELNVKNKGFFDACDGIFLNYSWTEKHLVNSVEMAKYRHYDVFVGLDVFGRNMYGGGQFNCFKAVDLIARHRLSLAIFAPGWTYETLEKSEKLFENFLNKDSAFWCSLWPYLYTHPIPDYFTTNFYIGLDKACYNIFNQQLQLSKFCHPKDLSSIDSHEGITTLVNKCGCILSSILYMRNYCMLTKKDLRKDVEYVHHLFACDIAISKNTVVFYLIKGVSTTQPKLTVTLLTSGMNSSMRKIRLLPTPQKELNNNSTILEVNPTEASDVYDTIRMMYSKMVKKEHWVLSAYVFNTKLCRILEVGATIEGEEDSIYLGAFGIESADGDFLKNK